jgi:hypothetical protein
MYPSGLAFSPENIQIQCGLSSTHEAMSPDGLHNSAYRIPHTVYVNHSILSTIGVTVYNTTVGAYNDYKVGVLTL